MKKIKLFLASSIREFKDERNFIGDCIRKIQDEVIDYGIRINLFECEFFDNSISKNGRKQDEYIKELIDTDIFIALIGKTVGEFTLEEYNNAKKYNVPHIYCIFKSVSHDEKVENLSVDLKNNNYAKFTYTTWDELEFVITKIVKELV